MTTRRDFIKYSGTAALTLGMLPLLSKAELFWPRDKLRKGFVRVSPESQGVSSAAISKFISAANASGLQWHSFMLLRHGNVIAEGWWKPFDQEFKHTLYSLSKSFTSTAIGLLVKDGKIKVEDSVISFFPDDLPVELSNNLKQMTIKHLLTMNTGHAEDTTPKMREGSLSWTKTFLSLPVEHTPGSHFLYNSGATYMLGAIVKKISGQDLETFLTPRLFEPLEIMAHDWEKSPDGLSVAGWGLRVKTEDIAKLGQLYLQKGKWKGQEILTEEWVRDAGSSQTASNSGDSDWSQGYGYQFWRCKPGFFRGDGAFGQYCIVMPQHDAVLAVTSESWDMQKQMSIMWDTLLTGMHASPLPENVNDVKDLAAAVSTLSIPVPKGSIQSALSKKYTKAKVTFPSNPIGVNEIQFDFSGEGCILNVNSTKGKHRIETGWEQWKINRDQKGYPFSASSTNVVPSKIAATSTWMESTLQINVKFVDGIHGDKISISFDENKVSVSFLGSVAENTKNNLEPRQKIEGKVV